nr:recombination signal binding protein for immunoglobulin kappa J region like [Molossus molossus]
MYRGSHTQALGHRPDRVPALSWSAKCHLEQWILPWNTKTCPSLYSLRLEPGTGLLPVFALWLTSLVAGQAPGAVEGRAILTVPPGTSLAGSGGCSPEDQGSLCCASSTPNPRQNLICMTHQ